MGSLGVVLGVFLMFSLAVSWVAGDKEKARLEDTVKENKTVQTQLTQEISLSKIQASKDADQLRDLEDKLRSEIDDKKRLERELAVEERRKRIEAIEGKNESGGNAGENGNTATGDSTTNAAPAPAPGDSATNAAPPPARAKSQQDADLSKEREKIRAEVEAKARSEEHTSEL